MLHQRLACHADAWLDHGSITGHEGTPNAGITRRFMIGERVRDDRLGLSR